MPKSIVADVIITAADTPEIKAAAARMLPVCWAFLFARFNTRFANIICLPAAATRTDLLRGGHLKEATA